jgi:hypothetical protein
MVWVLFLVPALGGVASAVHRGAWPWSDSGVAD